MRTGTSPNREGTKLRPIVALAGQHAPTGPAPATALAHHSHLRRHDLSLERRRELLRLSKLKPKLGQAALPITLDPGNFSPRHPPRPQPRTQLPPPHQFRH